MGRTLSRVTRACWISVAVLAGCGTGGTGGSVAPIYGSLSDPRRGYEVREAASDAPEPGGLAMTAQEGSLDQDDAEAAIKQHWRRMVRCYDEAGDARDFAGGPVTLHWVVGGDGRPTSVHVMASSLGSFEVERCLTGIATAVRFPAPATARPRSTIRSSSVPRARSRWSSCRPRRSAPPCPGCSAVCPATAVNWASTRSRPRCTSIARAPSARWASVAPGVPGRERGLRGPHPACHPDPRGHRGRGPGPNGDRPARRRRAEPAQAGPAEQAKGPREPGPPKPAPPLARAAAATRNPGSGAWAWLRTRV